MRTLTAIPLLALLAGCGGSDRPAQSRAADHEDPPAANSAEQDVAVLGREIFDLVDQSMSYRSAHRGRLPRSLRELGVDELTSATSRSLTTSDNVPTVTVSFRNTGGHVLSGCQGTNAVLEEAALGGGDYTLTCTLVTGGSTTLKAQR